MGALADVMFQKESRHPWPSNPMLHTHQILWVPPPCPCPPTPSVLFLACWCLFPHSAARRGALLLASWLLVQGDTTPEEIAGAGACDYPVDVDVDVMYVCLGVSVIQDFDGLTDLNLPNVRVPVLVHPIARLSRCRQPSSLNAHHLPSSTLSLLSVSVVGREAKS